MELRLAALPSAKRDPNVGTITSNCEDNYANLAINGGLIRPKSIEANFILEKQRRAPVFVAIHHHVRSLFEWCSFK